MKDCNQYTKSYFIKERIQENISTYKAVLEVKQYSTVVLQFTELELIKSILGEMVGYKGGKIKRLKNGVNWKDDFSSKSYILEYCSIINCINVFNTKDNKFIKEIDINKFIKKLDEYIDLGC